MTTRWPSRYRAFLAISLTCLVPAFMICQTGQQLDEFSSMYKGKIFLLRNFYAETDLEYDQNYMLVRGGVAGPWTLAGIRITQWAASAQGVDLIGERMGTWYRDGKPSLLKIGKLKIHVAVPISNADLRTELHAVLSKIFMEPGEDILPVVPEYWRFYLLGGDFNSRREAWRASLEKKSMPAFTPSRSAIGEIAPPRVTSSPDPKYAKEAEAQHIEGESKLIVVVDTTGSVDNVAILDPLGMGLDDQAVATLGRWKFQPGMKGGQPVRVQLSVDISFRCCP